MAALRSRLAAAEADAADARAALATAAAAAAAAAARDSDRPRPPARAAPEAAAPALLEDLLARATAAGAAHPRAAAAELLVSFLDANWRSPLRAALSGPDESAGDDADWDAAGVTGIYIDDEWVQFVDDDSRAYYYYSTVTGRTRWQKPPPRDAAPSPDAADGRLVVPGRSPGPPPPWSPPGAAGDIPAVPLPAPPPARPKHGAVLPCSDRDPTLSAAHFL